MQYIFPFSFNWANLRPLGFALYNLSTVPVRQWHHPNKKISKKSKGANNLWGHFCKWHSWKIQSMFFFNFFNLSVSTRNRQNSQSNNSSSTASPSQNNSRVQKSKWLLRYYNWLSVKVTPRSLIQVLFSFLTANRRPWCYTFRNLSTYLRPYHPHKTKATSNEVN